MSDERQRFEQLLPFYLNGTLTEHERVQVQAFLQQHPDLSESLVFSEHVRQAVKTLEPTEAPDPVRIDRLIERLSTARHPQKPQPKVTQWLRGLVIGGYGLGMAALTATLVFGVSTLPIGLLHGDRLDGQPDIQLSLAQGVEPTHETVAAQLDKHHGVIVNQSQLEGRHVIDIDLENRAASQDSLIQALQASGHIDDYTVLATR